MRKLLLGLLFFVPLSFLSLGATELTPQVVDETLGVVLKYEEDIRHVRGARVRDLLAETPAGR